MGGRSHETPFPAITQNRISPLLSLSPFSFPNILFPKLKPFLWLVYRKTTLVGMLVSDEPSIKPHLCLNTALFKTIRCYSPFIFASSLSVFLYQTSFFFCKRCGCVLECECVFIVMYDTSSGKQKKYLVIHKMVYANPNHKMGVVF